jgi:hypothetical protein
VAAGGEQQGGWCARWQAFRCSATRICPAFEATGDRDQLGTLNLPGGGSPANAYVMR